VNRKLIRSRVDWSAQWRSSTTRRRGCCSAAASKRACTASNSADRSTWGPMLAPEPEAALAALVHHPAAGREAVQGGVVAGDGGQHLGGRDLETAEDLGEREVGQGAVGEVEAVAGDDLPAPVEGAVAQRGEESGLADAGVAREEDDAARARVSGRDDAEPESEVLQLGISPHEGSSRDRCHAAHHVGWHRHGASGFGGRADHRVSRSTCAGAVFLPAQPATGTTGADGAPVLADPVHAVLDLRVDQHVVHRSSLSRSRAVPGMRRDSPPEVGANIGQVPYLCP
jgi:hypothetical protein